jgi:hypothetical protein
MRSLLSDCGGGTRNVGVRKESAACGEYWNQIETKRKLSDLEFLNSFDSRSGVGQFE